jgi:hypothetical protein
MLVSSSLSKGFNAEMTMFLRRGLSAFLLSFLRLFLSAILVTLPGPMKLCVQQETPFKERDLFLNCGQKSARRLSH